LNGKLKLLCKIKIFKTLIYNITYNKYFDISSLNNMLLIFGKSKIIKDKKSEIEIYGKAYIGFPMISKFYMGLNYSTLLNINCNSRLILNNNVRLGPETKIVVDKGGSIFIGENTYFSAENKIVCYNNIRIGNNCAISWGVNIMDNDGKSIDGRNYLGDINIGDECWIGAGATILRNTKIGEGSIVAANAVVKGIFPEKCIIAGNPAKIIKENISWR